MIAAAAITAASAQYELALPVQTLPANAGLGWDIGRAFAEHGLTPPVEHLFVGSPLRQGWLAGRQSFEKRTLKPRRCTQLWLQLRTHAWARGRSFEDVQLTPNFLRQIDVAVCPITRRLLNDRRGDAQSRSIDRVRPDAGYAAGNVAVLSRAANAAKAGHDHAGATALAQSVAMGPIQQIAGLGPIEWQRLAVLCSFVTELPHEQAAQLPMTVLPPNRLRLFNPIQALQALVTRHFSTPEWHPRLARLKALLPTEQSRVDFDRFVLAFAPRMIVASKQADPQQVRWALEDAWQQELVLKRWTRFALQLTAAQAESLVLRASEKGWISSQRVQRHPKKNATEGWALERRGFVSPAGRH